MNHIYWVGVRKSDLLMLDSLYEGSITLFGDGKNKNISLFKTGISRKNHNIELPVFAEFNKMAMQQIINEEPDAEFMFYNPILAYSLEKELRQRVICLNKIDLLKVLDDKMLCKLWLKNDVALIENVQMFGKEINIKNLHNIFGDKEKYIIQLPVSSGGTGTYLYDENNHREINSKIIPYKLYNVMPYYEEAISLNIHCVIYENTYQMYPLSIQLIIEENGNLLYKGCDFITADTLDVIIKQQIKIQTEKICDKLCRNNYRGVCGIDFMLINGKIYFSEINPRFQASTAALNLALYQQKQTTLNEATMKSFFSGSEPKALSPEIHVSYSLYAYEENEELRDFHKNIFRIYFESFPEYNLLKDGNAYDIYAEQGAYLFRALFPHPISDISSGRIRINELFSGFKKENPLDPLMLKIMLINWGVKITKSALSYIEKNGNLREANFSAIDIILWDKLIVNCPYRINHAEYSPFSIKLNDNRLFIYFFDNKITDIKIYYESNLNHKVTKSGIAYRSVAFLATDRLRVNYSPVCHYKKTGQGCRFCNLPDENQAYDFNDIKEIFNDYLNNENFQHILLGGGSCNLMSDFRMVTDLASFIRSKTVKPIYLMSLPPYDLKIIPKLYQAGISEVAFNIEIFDPILAEKYMPGKGRISRGHYYHALEEAVSIWGREGNVRSMVILGLESEETLLAGIERLCQIGVQPMLSIFRPMENTPFHLRLPLATQTMYELYFKIKNICNNHGLYPGPSCVYCQNNTLSLPGEYERMKILMK